ncbi:ABC transporter substrate-binding protein [Pseudooceanicola sp. CBS1P-1]|uniref:ABC transporter substrate-binding protein n=1 Tax=Pseudooceanicola albus TaxID=2692189 RepID=A0A6L7G399_9RHOB|nr:MULTISPECIES: ABC transporter substrate-binding protein [Pseudooceanicola]MBT9385307.1 ABC transporter substrate-binding protein [Pseudooceanicola endophyticus]MXN18834.1 ABC transporter substrate-binding protein [Pseudooceanicola albus]
MAPEFSKRLGAALLAATCLTTTLAAAQPALAHGVLRLDESAPGDIDPATGNDNADTILSINLYDALVAPKQGGTGYVPLLARSWSTEDGLTYTVDLRDDVTFLSGNPMTAEDVVFSLDRMKALGQGVSYLFDKVESAKAVDAHTVQFTLSSKFAPFVAALVRLPIFDKKTVMDHLEPGDTQMGDWGTKWLSQHSAGTGAYSVVSHNPQEETVMQRNPDYFLGFDEAAPDTVRLRYSLEPATVRTLIAQGEHDISSQWLPPEVMSALAKGGAQLLSEPAAGAFYIKFNTRKPPLDDANCRLALANAFDYASALKLVAVSKDISQGTAPTGLIPKGLMGADDESHTLKQDMAKAKEYLSQCKYTPSDYTLDISWIGEVPLEERFALLLQANFTQLGFKAEIRKMPWALFASQVTSPETTPMISQVLNTTATGDPDALLYNMYHSSAAGTWASPEWLKDDQVDSLLDEGRTETDPEKRDAIYHQLNDRLMALAPSINMYDAQEVFAGSTRISAPALSDPEKKFPLSPFGFTFRLIDVKD